MNKLLRNPWAVSALVIGMAALWWVQMRSILVPGGVAEAPPSALTSQEVAVENLAIDSRAIEPLVVPGTSLPTQLRWDSSPSRDPFGPVTTSAPVVLVTLEPVIAAPPEMPLTEVVPALEAVLNTPSAHIAVIDGRMVRVGDKVGGRAVLSIDNASVALGRSVDRPQPLMLKLPIP